MKYISFEWDQKKDLANIQKHGISFEEARSVFYDNYARVMHDPDHSEDEERYLILGWSKKLNILVVCHCYRENDEVIRLISARKATKSEKKRYEEFKK